MTASLIVNLAVADLDRSVAFFTELGFGFNPALTDDNGACLVIGDNAYVMLLRPAYFSAFTKKGIADSATTAEAILAVTVDSRAEVDRIVNAALASGGSPANDPEEISGVYGWSFHDPDGHLWEVLNMDVPRGPRPGREG
ncbi:VOC family protein [Streptomonospora nanhaiensis]|uniref:VOC domain-containing protein n=1 Tax=Streptomonospora nanhaiensis TaxID=1323731 RepID=A0A853BKX9_9ACTN|nr:VOC family protein [Streptomonospora nanhaiensis]NYI95660.1 hypothetical protein [Streptomonospora nanhaiensis]